MCDPQYASFYCTSTSIPLNTVYYNDSRTYTYLGIVGTTPTFNYNATPSATSCDYRCADGYMMDGTTSTCVLAPVTGNCQGLATNGVFYNGTTNYSLNNAPGGTSLTGSYISGTIPQNTCEFNCSNGYNWDGSECIQNLVSGACQGRPDNTHYYGDTTNYDLVNAPAGTSLTGTYSAGDIVQNTCGFNCDTGYGWSDASGACIGQPVTGNCGGLPTSNTAFYGGATTYQISNAPFGTTLNPMYNDTPKANTCEFNCAANYAWDSVNNDCFSTLVNGTCTNLPPNASYYGGATTYTLNAAPANTALIANYSTTTPEQNTCEFSCNTNYAWNGTTCGSTVINGPCTDLPAGGIYYG